MMKMSWIIVVIVAVTGCSSRSSNPAQTVSQAPRGSVQESQQEDRVAQGEALEARKPSTAHSGNSAGPAVQAEAHEKPSEAVTHEFGSAMARAHPEQAKAMRTAAQKAWEATQASYEVGTTTLERLHYWSKELLLAERALAETNQEDLAAVLRYWKRTKHIYLKVRALFNTGTRGGETEKLATASYYLAEADLWLLEAGGTVPESTD
jgi:chemotaxis protein histidine kinase CheA